LFIIISIGDSEIDISLYCIVFSSHREIISLELSLAELIGRIGGLGGSVELPLGLLLINSGVGSSCKEQGYCECGRSESTTPSLFVQLQFRAGSGIEPGIVLR